MHMHHEHGPEQGDRRAAKLGYLYDHNCRHQEELKELAEELTGAAKEQLLAAMALYAQANEALHQALHALEEER